jgi:hypothetical protein
MTYSITGKQSATYTVANVSLTNGGYTSITAGNIGLNNSINYSTASWAMGSSKVKITDSDIEIEGLSLKRTLQTINERLAVMVPNPALEKEFEELKKCGDEYRRLEREFAEQLKMWNTLKSTDNK